MPGSVLCSVLGTGLCDYDMLCVCVCRAAVRAFLSGVDIVPMAGTYEAVRVLQRKLGFTLLYTDGAVYWGQYNACMASSADMSAEQSVLAVDALDMASPTTRNLLARRINTNSSLPSLVWAARVARVVSAFLREAHARCGGGCACTVPWVGTHVAGGLHGPCMGMYAGRFAACSNRH